MATDCLQILCGSHFARILRIRRFFHRFRVQTLANVVHATGCEDRTPCRTHIFLSVAHLITDHHMHLRVAQVWDVLCASKRSPTHNMCHRPLLDVPDPFPSFCSTPPSSTLTGIRSFPCATPHGGFQFGRLVEPTPLTSYQPKTCIDISSEHTPMNYPSKRNSFNTDYNDITHHSRSLRTPSHERSGTVDFTTVLAGARSKL